MLATPWFSGADGLLCVNEQRSEWECSDPDMIHRVVNSKDGSIVSENTFSANYGRLFMAHGVQAFTEVADADYVEVGSTTIVNNSACDKRVVVHEESAITGRAVLPSRGRYGTAHRLVINGTNFTQGTGVSDAYTTNDEYQSDQQHGATYLFTVPPGISTVSWQKQFTSVENSSVRHSNSRLVFTWVELNCC